jgi:hypothetical protein
MAYAAATFRLTDTFFADDAATPITPATPFTPLPDMLLMPRFHY